MQKKAWLPIKIILLLLVLLAFPRTASAYYTNMPASVVVGQSDFDSNTSGTTSATLRAPENLIVVDGKLVVADTSNHRVLIWNKIPTDNGAAADVVLGQPDFVSETSNNGGRSAQTLSRPTGVTSDGQKLIVADRNNNRVLIWNSLPTENFQSADVVVGQPEFTIGVANQGGSVGANTLYHPEAVFTDGEKLFIADKRNYRVLIFNSIPTSNNASADVVLGQPDFASNIYHGVGSSSLDWPRGVFYDGQRLIVTEENIGRILMWNRLPTTNGTAADVVIGKPDFTSTTARVSRSEITKSVHPGIFNERLFVDDAGNHRVMIYNSIPTTNGASADIVLGQPDFLSNSPNHGGEVSATTMWYPFSVYVYGDKLFVVDNSNHRVLIFEDYEATATPGFTVNYPPESSGVKMRLSGNIVMGEYGKFDLRSPEVSINNQGFGSLTNFSKRQHSDHETISEFYHDFEPWAGVAPRDEWSEGDGFTAHFRATSYQSRIETQEAFLFWPFTLDSVNADSAVPVFSFHIPSKNVDYIKSNLDRFEVYIGKEGNFSKYLSRVPMNLVGEDGRVIVSADSEGVQTAQATFLPGEYEVKVRAFDKWGNHFDSNAMPLTLTQTLVSVESTPLFSGFWFPLQINRATGINTGIISSFRPESVLGSYSTSTLKPMFTGIAFADSLITMTVVNNQNPDEVKTFTTTTGPNSTWSLTPTLYPDSTVSITAQKAGLSAQIQPFPVRLLNAQ